MKKQYAIICIIASILSFTVSGFIFYNVGYNSYVPIEPDGSPIVRITPSGEKYHKTSCRYVKNNKKAIEISIIQAKEKGYSPCSRCKPDRLLN